MGQCLGKGHALDETSGRCRSTTQLPKLPNEAIHSKTAKDHQASDASVNVKIQECLHKSSPLLPHIGCDPAYGSLAGKPATLPCIPSPELPLSRVKSEDASTPQAAPQSYPTAESQRIPSYEYSQVGSKLPILGHARPLSNAAAITAPQSSNTEVSSGSIVTFSAASNALSTSTPQDLCWTSTSSPSGIPGSPFLFAPMQHSLHACRPASSGMSSASSSITPTPSAASQSRLPTPKLAGIPPPPSQPPPAAARPPPFAHNHPSPFLRISASPRPMEDSKREHKISTSHAPYSKPAIAQNQAAVGTQPQRQHQPDVHSSTPITTEFPSKSEASIQATRMAAAAAAALSHLTPQLPPLPAQVRRSIPSLANTRPVFPSTPPNPSHHLRGQAKSGSDPKSPPVKPAYKRTAPVAASCDARLMTTNNSLPLPLEQAPSTNLMHGQPSLKLIEVELYLHESDRRHCIVAHKAMQDFERGMGPVSEVSAKSIISTRAPGLQSNKPAIQPQHMPTLPGKQSPATSMPSFYPRAPSAHPSVSPPIPTASSKSSGIPSAAQCSSRTSSSSSSSLSDQQSSSDALAAAHATLIAGPSRAVYTAGGYTASSDLLSPDFHQQLLRQSMEDVRSSQAYQQSMAARNFRIPDTFPPPVPVSPPAMSPNLSSPHPPLPSQNMSSGHAKASQPSMTVIVDFSGEGADTEQDFDIPLMGSVCANASADVLDSLQFMCGDSAVGSLTTDQHTGPWAGCYSRLNTGDHDAGVHTPPRFSPRPVHGHALTSIPERTTLAAQPPPRVSQSLQGSNGVFPVANMGLAADSSSNLPRARAISNPGSVGMVSSPADPAFKYGAQLRPSSGSVEAEEEERYSWPLSLPRGAAESGAKKTRIPTFTAASPASSTSNSGSHAMPTYHTAQQQRPSSSSSPRATPPSSAAPRSPMTNPLSLRPSHANNTAQAPMPEHYISCSNGNAHYRTTAASPFDTPAMTITMAYDSDTQYDTTTGASAPVNALAYSPPHVGPTPKRPTSARPTTSPAPWPATKRGIPSAPNTATKPTVNRTPTHTSAAHSTRPSSSGLSKPSTPSSPRCPSTPGDVTPRSSSVSNSGCYSPHSPLASRAQQLSLRPSVQAHVRQQHSTHDTGSGGSSPRCIASQLGGRSSDSGSAQHGVYQGPEDTKCGVSGSRIPCAGSVGVRTSMPGGLGQHNSRW